LDDVVYVDDEVTLSDLLPSKEYTNKSVDVSDLSTGIHESLEYLISTKLLKTIQVDILKMRFGIGCAEMSFGEIAYQLGFSRERVKRYYEEAVKKIRKS
jgi:DNA-directed RNA polymerase sigma subunit (sigma70/sigma32)